MPEKSTALVPSRSEMVPTQAALRDMHQRVERLEDVVAVLCDTKAMEDRIVQRVAAQFSGRNEPPRQVAAQAESGGMSNFHMDAAAPSNGVSTSTPHPPTATFAEFVLPDVDMQSRAPVTMAGFSLPPVSHPVTTTKTTTVKLALGMLPGSSLLQSIWWDIKTFLAMWRDPLYTMTMAGRFIPILALFCVLAVPLLRKIPVMGDFIPNFGDFLGNLLNIILLYIAFKVVSRELQRYHEFATKYRR